jgi:hypothetical protein
VHPGDPPGVRASDQFEAIALAGLEERLGRLSARGEGDDEVRQRCSSSHRPSSWPPLCGFRFAWPSARLGRFLELEESDRVAVGIDEPGREREADVGDPVDHPQTRHVLELDPPRAQLGCLGGEIVHAP